MFKYKFPRPAVTADVVMFTMRADDLAVLLIRRGAEPFEGSWALPGGFVDENEALERAAARELEEETGVSGVPMEQLGAFGNPGRDPRGHTVTVAYFTFVLAESVRARAGDDAADVAWHPLRSLPLRSAFSPRAKPRTRSKPPPITLAFDHDVIIDAALGRLRERLDDPPPTLALPARAAALHARRAPAGLRGHPRPQPRQAELPRAPPGARVGGAGGGDRPEDRAAPPRAALPLEPLTRRAQPFFRFSSAKSQFARWFRNVSMYFGRRFLKSM